MPGLKSKASDFMHIFGNEKDRSQDLVWLYVEVSSASEASP